MYFEWLLLMQLIMGSIMIILLHNQIKMKKQLDEMTREVTNYISYITEDMTEDSLEEKMYSASERNNKFKGKEEDQNRLIQTVLGEFFP